MKPMLRALLQNNIFSLYNIIGSTIGMTCTMLLLLWVYSLHTSDRYSKISHAAKKRISHKLISIGPEMLYSSPAVNFPDAVEPVQTR